MKKILALFLVLVALWAQYNDNDLDGVPDYLDRCPNTPFSDIVDQYGCSIEKLIKPRRYEYYYEFLYAKDKRLDFQERDYLMNVTLYHDNFDFAVTSFYYNNNFKKGFSDISIKIEYRFTPTPMWDIYVGAGLELPTYNLHGNKTDYTLSFNNEYYFLGYKFYGGTYYTIVGDSYKNHKLKDNYGAFLGMEYYYRRYSFDIAYLYNHGKFGSITNMSFFKLERRLKNHYYLFATYSVGLDSQAIDNVYSIGFGRRY